MKAPDVRATMDAAGSENIPDEVLGRGVYGAAEALRLVNFQRTEAGGRRKISRQTMVRWLRGYDHGNGRHSEPLWRPDYLPVEESDESVIDVSFRDLIELRFVKAFRDAGLGLRTIRACFARAVETVQDE